MKKRTAVIGALVALMPMGQPLLIGTGAALTTTAVMLAIPEKVQAESADFYYNRGLKKAKSGDYLESNLDYIKTIKINPQYADAYYQMAWNKLRMRDYPGAISSYLKFVRLNPYNPTVQLLRMR